jgi:hypothetical protein
MSSSSCDSTEVNCGVSETVVDGTLGRGESISPCGIKTEPLRAIPNPSTRSSMSCGGGEDIWRKRFLLADIADTNLEVSCGSMGVGSEGTVWQQVSESEEDTHDQARTQYVFALTHTTVPEQTPDYKDDECSRTKR